MHLLALNILQQLLVLQPKVEQQFILSLPFDTSDLTEGLLSALANGSLYATVIYLCVCS